MKIHDISMAISEDIMVYKDQQSKKPKIMQVATFENSSYYESAITMNLHTGTHIDAPLHMLEDGLTMACYPIEKFVSQAKVLDMTHLEDKISEKDFMDKELKKGDFILLKTRNSYDLVFNNNFIYLDASGAKYLSQLEIKGVGIDGLGIERSQPNHETHRFLFEKEIIIVEGLDLKEITEGTYQLIVLPLKLVGVEAAPARAILLEMDENI